MVGRAEWVTGDVVVRPLSATDDGVLGAFLDELGEREPLAVLAYHYPFYRDMLVAIDVGVPASLGAWRDGCLKAVLPAFRRTAAAGSVLCSLPFFGPNGGVLCAAGEAGWAVPALIRAAVAMLDELPDPLALTICGPLEDRNGAETVAAMEDRITVERFSQVTTLDGTPWSKSLRYDIRRAESLGVTVVEEADPDHLREFFRLYETNCAEAGIPLKPFAALEALARHAHPEGPVRLYFAMHDDRMVAGLMVLWGPRCVSYYMPCTLAEARALQPGALLIDRAVADARTNGKTFWNWESSPSREGGVYRFKQRWNACEKSYCIRILARRPPARFVELGRLGLSQAFPGYFVYPFDRL